MTRQITISLVKIMNWSHTEHDTKLELSFLYAHNRSYIAHKSVYGSYIDNTILLNTSFKISYQENQHNLICKVAILKEHRTKEVVGEAELDLECFFNRKIQYIAFTDRDKVVEIHRVDDANQTPRDQSQHDFIQRDEQSQQHFLQQRYNFLDKITNRQIQLKKDFSQKVYNLLKDIKYARATENLKKQVQEKRNIRQKSEEHQFETPAKEEEKTENLKKMQGKVNQISENINGKNQLGKASKPYKLMIDSIQAYGKKQQPKQYNIYSRNQKEQHTEEEEEHVFAVKKGNKEVRNIYKN